MKKVVLVVATLALTTASLALEIEVQAGDAFAKVMSKNRSSKNMAGSNYVSIKNNDDLEKHGKKDLGITIDASKKNIGTIYNYVEIKNVKSKTYKKDIKDKKINKYNKENKEEERNYGINIKTKKGFNRGVRGKIHNKVKIENSDLD